jgi:predicted dienelactone hydrolase
MPLRSYVFPEPPSEEFKDLVFLTSRWDEYSYRGLTGKDSTAFDRLMSTNTAVCSNAAIAAGRFPLVLYSAGWFNRAPDNAILAEFLTSHGFVVASVPQLNPGLWTYNFQSDATSVENQIRDLEVALGVLVQESFVDRRRIATMGYSTGGDVALLLQARNPLIDAVVGLDASWTLGPDNDVQSPHGFTTEQHRVPILAARRPPQGGAGYNSVLDALTAAPRVVVEIPGADHGSFSDDPAERNLLGAGTAEHRATHAVVAEAVVAFLREALLSRVPFDGDSLAEQYRSRGLVAAAFSPVAPKRAVDEQTR